MKKGMKLRFQHKYVDRPRYNVDMTLRIDDPEDITANEFVHSILVPLLQECGYAMPSVFKALRSDGLLDNTGVTILLRGDDE